MTYLTINTVDLASELAEREMNRRHPEGWEGMEDGFKNESLQDEFHDLYDEYKTIVKASAYQNEKHQTKHGIDKAIDKIYWALIAYIEDSAGKGSKEAEQVDKAWKLIHSLIYQD